jgi:hypothetical protein
MTRRRLLLFGLPIGLAIGVWLLWPRSAITRENAAKIQNGMTLEEVEAILGGPARHDATGPVTADLDTDADTEREDVILPNMFFAERGGAKQWQSDYAAVLVHFDEAGCVDAYRIIPLRREHESPLNLLRRCLRRSLRL